MYVPAFSLFFSICMHLKQRYEANVVFRSLLGAELPKEVDLAILTQRTDCTGELPPPLSASSPASLLFLLLMGDVRST